MLESPRESTAEERVHAGVDSLERVKVGDGGVEGRVEVLGEGDVVGGFPALAVGEELDNAVLGPLRELVSGGDSVGVARRAGFGGSGLRAKRNGEGTGREGEGRSYMITCVSA